MTAKLLAGGRMRRTHQKGTKLEDCGDSWRFRYRLWDKDGVEERPTEYDAMGAAAADAIGALLNPKNEGVVQ